MTNKIISLSGEWDYAKEISNYENCGDFKDICSWDKIKVPGCWDIIPAISRLYEGPIIYRKKFIVPESMKGKKAFIEFEGVNYYCKIWLNGSFAGSHEGGWDAFRFDITPYIIYGSQNILYAAVIKQGETFPPKETTAGFLPDITYNYGGIYRDVRIIFKEHIGFDSVSVTSGVEDKKIKVKAKIYNSTDSNQKMELKTRVDWPHNIKNQTFIEKINLDKGLNNIEYDINIDPVICWDCDNPNLYEIEINLIYDENIYDVFHKKVGMRDISIEGNRILLNGKPLYIRGLLHWGYYPELISPNPDREMIKQEINKVKSMGFNMIKHCLYIPSKDYYELADEMGLLLWQELPMWLPAVTDKFKERSIREYQKIMEQIHDHPSIIIYTLGCELDSTVDEKFLGNLYEIAKSYSMGALITDNSGSGECYDGHITNYSDFYDYHFYAELQYIESLMEVFTPSARKMKPWLYGEFCDYDTFTDRRQIIEENNGEIPWWLSKSPDRNPQYDRCLHYNGIKLPLVDQEDIMAEEDYVRENIERIKEVSYKQGLINRKFTVEAARSFPELSGYNITVIRDSHLSGSGIFDYKMRPKFNADDFKLFNDDVVLCLSWDLTRQWKNGGDRPAYNDRYNYWSGQSVRPHIIISNFSSENIEYPQIDIKVTDEENKIIYESRIKSEEIIKSGEVKEAVIFNFTAPKCLNVQKFTLHAQIDVAGQAKKNRWNIWVYPNNEIDRKDKGCIYDPPKLLREIYSAFNVIKDLDSISLSDVLVTTYMDNRIEKFIADGGRVFYIQRGWSGLPIVEVPFWRESIRLMEDHPAIENFKKEDGFNLQGFGLATDTAFDPKQIKGYDKITPIITRVDGRRYRRSDYLFEMKKGRGKIIASTLRFEGGMGKQPTGIKNNTAAIYLFNEIFRYLTI